MMLLVFLVAMIGSWVPLFLIPPSTGGWFLMALLSGALTAYFGWALVGMQALSDNIGVTYYAWWVVAIALAGAGSFTFLYALAALLWRGAGLSIHVDVHQ